MADKSLFSRLGTLFSNGRIITRGKSGVKVVDINKVQTTDRLASNRLVDRYNRLYQSSQTLGYNQQSNYHTQRLILFSDYESMDQDPIIASALDIYAEESSLKNEYGDIIKVKSSNSHIEESLNNLFYNVLNIEFNLYLWIRNMCKYGDFYLKLDIMETLGIVNVIPISTYEMLREEGTNPSNPEYVRFKHDPSVGGQSMAYGQLTGEKLYDNYEIAHFRLISDANFLPYGRSMIEPARKVWKQLTLMEDAMMIHRIMRAPERRIFKIDIGNIPPSEVEQHMQRVINTTKKTPYMDNTGQYDLKFNLTNMMEDYYMPVRGGQSGTEIASLPGMEWTGIDDINYLKEKMFAALKVPKAFLGYEEGVDGKATLAAQDVRFSKTIERIQKIIVSELTKIAIVHLYSQGYTDENLVDFELYLTNASTIHEQEMNELWTSKAALSTTLIDGKLLSRNWIYRNIWKLSDDDIEVEMANIIEDTKVTFRRSQIETDGSDPKNPPSPIPETEPTTDNVADTNETNFGGRPPEGTKYGQQDSARGRDALGYDTMKRDVVNRDRSITSEEKRYIAKHLFSKKEQVLSKIDTNSTLLNESNIIDDIE
jgi:hypothetical protein